MSAKKKKKETEEIINHINNTDKKVSHMFDWLIEFSKKVVFSSFIMYLVSTTVIICIIIANRRNGDMTGFELFITETNNTFKIVVGSYVIKAALENIIKIGGGKYQELVKIKHKLYKEVMKKNTGVDFSDINMNIPNNSSNDNSNEEEINNDGI